MFVRSGYNALNTLIRWDSLLFFERPFLKTLSIVGMFRCLEYMWREEFNSKNVGISVFPPLDFFCYSLFMCEHRFVNEPNEVRNAL